jgi:hypothetical protein
MGDEEQMALRVETCVVEPRRVAAKWYIRDGLQRKRRGSEGCETLSGEKE